MRVVPDSRLFVRGYKYTVGDLPPFFLDAADVIHFKTRHPLDDYYGLAPLAVLAGRVDLDVWTRRFAESFFRNAGVPAGLMNIQRAMNEVERGMVQRRFRDVYGGSEGWHKIMVLDGGAATYTQMGLGMGESGLAMNTLGMTNETRICGVYGVPTSLIPTMAGQEANRGQTAAVSDRELFWEQTMVPWFRRKDSVLNAKLLAEWPDLTRIEHDLSQVKALQEDQDKLHARYRADYEAGAITWQEFRQKCGYPEEPDEPGMLVIAVNMVPTWSDTMLKEPEPEPLPAAGDPNADNPELGNPAKPAPALPAAAGRANGRTNGAAH
jgi:HK97 family phage portal protein